MALELVGLLIHRLVPSVDVVVRGPCGHGMHVQGAEILVHVVLQLLEHGFSRLVRDFLRIRRDFRAVLRVGCRHMRQQQPVAKLLQVLVVHPAGVFHDPVDFGAILDGVGEAGLDEVVGVHALAQPNERALVRVASPNRVVLLIHGKLQAVRWHFRVCGLVWALALWAYLQIVASLGIEGRVAVLLVKNRVQRPRRVQAPEADASHQRARSLVPNRRELRGREHVDVVEVPEWE